MEILLVGIVWFFTGLMAHLDTILIVGAICYIAWLWVPRGGVTHSSVTRSSVSLGAVHSSQFTLNGMTFKVTNGRVTVNGQLWGPIGEDGVAVPLPEVPRIVLNQDGTITGPIHGGLIIEGAGHVTLIVQGGVEGSVEVEDGNVTCGNVSMSVEAGGNVECKNVGLSVEAGGNVTCGNVNLGVEAGGNIYRK